MYFLFLLASFAATTLSLFLRWKSPNGPYTTIRIAFIQSLILQGIIIFFYNEVFSFFNLITPLTARLYWFLVAVVTGGWLANSLSSKAARQQLTLQLNYVLKLTTIDLRSRFLIYGGLGFLLLPLLTLAIYAPPSNYDSNHYHLNRILYWLNDHNLDHYPTVHVQQLYHNVFGEYLVLHTFLLTGSDQLANVIQFVAMLGSVMAVSLLARCIGLRYRGQLLAGILMMCLPISLFESTTTQVDSIACFFFTSFVMFGYWFLVQPSRLMLIWLLLALVFGSFTKYPVLFFALPFTIYFASQILRRYGIRFSLITLTSAILLYGLVFVPFFTRNYVAFGAILHPRPTSRLLNEKIPAEKFSVALTASNLIKNMGLHIGTPYTPYNLWAESVIVHIHQLLGVSVDEPAITKDHFQVRFSMQEDSAPNTVHLFVLLIAVLFLFSQRGHSIAKLLFGLSLAGIVLYCSLFKFQWFNTRIHMLFFAIGCVIIAYVYATILKRNGFYLALLLYGLSMLIILGNPNKMVIPLRYVAKRVLAHIPRDIGIATVKEQQTFMQTVGHYYKPVSTASCPLCLSLRRPYTYAERLKIFRKLDSIHYFRHDKEESILFETRTQAYFASHPTDYECYSPLLAHIGTDVQNVGFLTGTDSGFYHFWSALNQQTDHPVAMAYIRYPREYAELPNAHRRFDYNYILSDDSTLVHRLIKPGEIAEMHTSNKLLLIRLKHVSRQTYLF